MRKVVVDPYLPSRYDEVKPVQFGNCYQIFTALDVLRVAQAYLPKGFKVHKQIQLKVVKQFVDMIVELGAKDGIELPHDIGKIYGVKEIGKKLMKSNPNERKYKQRTINSRDWRKQAMIELVNDGITYSLEWQPSPNLLSGVKLHDFCVSHETEQIVIQHGKTATNWEQRDYRNSKRRKQSGGRVSA